MNYIYHWVPENMKGEILYPLNHIKKIHPEIYQERIKKYEGRERVMGIKIPALNVLWNDVLHFTSVDPKQIKEAFRELGINKTRKYYKIPADVLDPEKTIILRHGIKDDGKTLNVDDIESYSPEKVSEFSTLPEVTKAYYKRMLSEGKNPLVHNRVPHILYNGSLNIKDIPIIEV